MCFEPANTTVGRLLELLEDPVTCSIIVLCPLGFVMNILTITATALIPSGQTVHSKLIISLGISDMLITVGVSLHFLFLVAYDNGDRSREAAKKSFIDFGFHATLTNLLVMAGDHYMAIMRPLEYAQIMTPVRGHCILAGIWATSLVAGLTDYFLSYNRVFEWQYIIIGTIMLVFFVIVGIYGKIYVEVRKIIHRNRAIHREEIHDTKAIITTSLIIITFFLCWMPNAMFNVIVAVKINVDRDAFRDCDTKKFYQALALFLFIPMVTNTLCDPLIYATRLKMVKMGYKRMFHKIKNCTNYGPASGHVPFSSAERRSTTVTLINSSSLQENEMHLYNRDQDILNSTNSEEKRKSLDKVADTKIPEITSLCDKLNHSNGNTTVLGNGTQSVLYENDDNSSSDLSGSQGQCSEVIPT